MSAFRSSSSPTACACSPRGRSYHLTAEDAEATEKIGRAVHNRANCRAGSPEPAIVMSVPNRGRARTSQPTDADGGQSGSMFSAPSACSAVRSSLRPAGTGCSLAEWLLAADSPLKPKEHAMKACRASLLLLAFCCILAVLFSLFRPICAASENITELWRSPYGLVRSASVNPSDGGVRTIEDSRGRNKMQEQGHQSCTLIHPRICAGNTEERHA